jgi:type IV secretion system protein VirB4
LTGTLALAPEARTLSRLLEFLDPTITDGAWVRLSPWCQAQDGPLAWAFDAAPDRMGEVFGSGSLLGIDVTEFLEHAAVRTPLTLYLFHRVRSLLDGRRLACWCDEFWRLLEDPAFEHFAKDAPKTWRKLNALLCLSTQSPSDVLASPISRTIIEQTPTKIFLPNPEAAGLDYAEGFGLTEREVRLIAVEMAPASRRFLLRQGRRSLVCELDLKGFTGELAVIASRAQTLAIVNRLIAECGAEPQHWLPPFLWAASGKPMSDFHPITL